MKILLTFRDPTKKFIIDRLGKKCIVCGSNKNLHIHHKKYQDLEEVIKDLELLCANCHQSISIYNPKILKFVKDNPNSCITEIAKKMGLLGNQIIPNINILVKENLIKKRKFGKKALLNLTSKGLEISKYHNSEEIDLAYLIAKNKTKEAK